MEEELKQHGNGQNQEVTVAFVDPENLVRDGINRIITSLGGFKVVLEAADAETALQKLEKSQASVVITEVALPGRSGLDLLLELRRRKLQTHVVMLSRLDTEAVVRQALASGATGYVLKSSSTGELKQALESAARGETYVVPALSSALEASSNTITPDKLMADPLAALSPREREIFFLLASGDHNTAIAKKLFISPRTVETHRSRVVKKLGLVSNAELIRFAIRHGLSVVS